MCFNAVFCLIIECVSNPVFCLIIERVSTPVFCLNNKINIVNNFVYGHFVLTRFILITKRLHWEKLLAVNSISGRKTVYQG